MMMMMILRLGPPVNNLTNGHKWLRDRDGYNYLVF